MAVALLEEWAIQDHPMSVSEVDRYLGLPAQAISYKVGERAWLDSREAAKKRLGDRFDLKAFHATLSCSGRWDWTTSRRRWPAGTAPSRARSLRVRNFIDRCVRYRLD